MFESKVDKSRKQNGNFDSKDLIDLDPKASVSTTATVSSLKTKEWMTTEEVAIYLGLSAGAVRNMTSNGQLPYYKLGRRNRYLVDELRQLLLSLKRGGSYGH